MIISIKSGLLSRSCQIFKNNLVILNIGTAMKRKYLMNMFKIAHNYLNRIHETSVLKIF